MMAPLYVASRRAGQPHPVTTEIVRLGARSEQDAQSHVFASRITGSQIWSGRIPQRGRSTHWTRGFLRWIPIPAVPAELQPLPGACAPAGPLVVGLSSAVTLEADHRDKGALAHAV